MKVKPKVVQLEIVGATEAAPAASLPTALLSVCMFKFGMNIDSWGTQGEFPGIRKGERHS